MEPVAYVQAQSFHVVDRDTVPKESLPVVQRDVGQDEERDAFTIPVSFVRLFEEPQYLFPRSVAQYVDYDDSHCGRTITV